MLTQHYLRAVCIAVIMLVSCNAVSFAQGTTAPLKPLSVGTVTLYYSEYVSNGWSTYRIGPGTYHTDYYDWKKKGYFFTKVIGDTVINGKEYAIIYTPNTYTNSQEYFVWPDLHEIVYERQTDSALFQFIRGYDLRRQQTDYERVVFNIRTKEYNDFYGFHAPFSDCTTQGEANEFEVSCIAASQTTDHYAEESVTIKSGYGLIQMAWHFKDNFSNLSDYEEGKSIFVGAMSDGKVLGDSLVLFLDTDWNTLDTLRRNRALFSQSSDNNSLRIRSHITSNVLSLRLTTTIDQNVTIEIYNLLGQLVHRSDSLYVQKGLPQVDINTNYWVSGLYFIRVYSKEGVSTSKILISN